MGFFSDLSGGTAARASRRGAAAQVLGLKKAKKELKKGIGYLEPYEQTGQDSNKLLADALGVNGPEAQAAYFANFQQDPGYLAERDAGVAAVDQGAAAGGMLRSGGTMKALQEYGQRFQRQSFLDRLGFLQNMGGQGFQAASGQANIRGQIAGAQADMGTARASGIVGAANARTAGSQNLFNAGVSLAGSALKAFAPVP